MSHGYPVTLQPMTTKCSDVVIQLFEQGKNVVCSHDTLLHRVMTHYHNLILNLANFSLIQLMPSTKSDTCLKSVLVSHMQTEHIF